MFYNQEKQFHKEMAEIKKGKTGNEKGYERNKVEVLGDGIKQKSTKKCKVRLTIR